MRERSMRNEMERELGEMNVRVYLDWEMIVVQLSYNFRSTLTFFFFKWSTIGSVFLHVGPKYSMVNLKKKIVKLVQTLY
jgi:hypothetical protein